MSRSEDGLKMQKDLRGKCWADLTEEEKQSLHEDVREIMEKNPDIRLVGRLASRKKDDQEK